MLSDIHGNLQALEAVIEDLEKQSPDEVWCGGDIAWGAPWGSECIQETRRRGWRTVRGNTDVWITGDPQTVESEEDRKKLIALAQAHDISNEDSQWLLNLPIGHSGPGSILLVHGTPKSPFVAPLPTAATSEFDVFQGKATLVVYGHVHHAFVRRLAAGTLVCNTGSVGLPMDGEAASYLLIDQKGPELMLRHRRVPFDRSSAIDEAKKIGGLVAEHFVESMNAAHG